MISHKQNEYALRPSPFRRANVHEFILYMSVFSCVSSVASVACPSFCNPNQHTAPQSDRILDEIIASVPWAMLLRCTNRQYLDRFLEMPQQLRHLSPVLRPCRVRCVTIQKAITITLQSLHACLRLGRWRFVVGFARACCCMTSNNTY